MGEARRRKKLDPNYGKKPRPLRRENSSEVLQERLPISELELPEFWAKQQEANEMDNPKLDECVYLIKDLEKDDFLVGEVEGESMTHRRWVKHPGGAMKFSTYELAAERVRKIVLRSGKNLAISTMKCDGDRYQVDLVVEVSKNPGLFHSRR